MPLDAALGVLEPEGPNGTSTRWRGAQGGVERPLGLALSVHVLGELQTTVEYVSSDIAEWTMFGEGMGPQAGKSVLAGNPKLVEYLLGGPAHLGAVFR